MINGKVIKKKMMTRWLETINQTQSSINIHDGKYNSRRGKRKL